MKTCSIDGCDRKHHAHGLCGMHNARRRYHGDPQAGGPERHMGDTSARFWAKVDRQADDECWSWFGAKSTNGYGRFFVDGRNVTAHRFAYELLVGPIPEGLDIDHMCHNRDANCRAVHACPHRACVNPAHLSPATRSVNMKRSFVRTSPEMAA